MSFNIARLSRGPAFVAHRGVQFFSKSPVALKTTLETFDIGVEGFSEAISKRKKNSPISISFTPSGEWRGINLLHPHRERVIGASLHDVIRITAIDLTTNVLTAPANNLDAGTRVRVVKIGSATFPTLSSGTMNEVTDYYVSTPSGGTLKLHDTAAHALAGTNALDFTVAGTGVLKLIAIYSLTIYPFNPGDDAIVFHNVVVKEQPDIIGSTQGTLFGAVTFEAFPVPGMNRQEANAIYTIIPNTGIVSDFAPSSIYTQVFSHTWGNAAPWDSWGTEKGFVLKAPMKTSAIQTDEDGILSYTLDDIQAMLTAQPKGLNLEDLLSKMAIQGGASSLIGAAVEGAAPDDLACNSDNVSVVLYNAGLLGGDANWTKSTDRLGELTWFASRPVLTDPLYLIDDN